MFPHILLGTVMSAILGSKGTREDLASVLCRQDPCAWLSLSPAGWNVVIYMPMDGKGFLPSGCGDGPWAGRAVEGELLASFQRVWGTVWQVRYNPSSWSISCCGTRACSWRHSCPQGCVLRCRPWTSFLNHPYLDRPYLMLHIRATATWAIANWTEGLHLIWIVTERSSSFPLQTLKTCPTLRSVSDAKRGDRMGARGLRVPLLRGHCCASLPAYRAWHSRIWEWGVPDHVVSACPTSCCLFP